MMAHPTNNPAAGHEVRSSADKPDRLLLLLLVSISFIVYLLTAAPGAGAHDSAELALRAWQLGATHAPGAPLHTVTGYILNLLTNEPATATNLLSMIAGALTAGALYLVLRTLAVDRAIAFGSAVFFALIFPIWGNAIITETYSLSLALLAFAILMSLRWLQTGERRQLFALTILYGAAFAAHFAMVLLLPAFVYLVLAGPGKARHNVPVFAVGVGVFMFLTMIANVLLALNVPPFGQAVPDSLTGLFLYMSGAEHQPLAARGTEFFLTRIVEHAQIFTRHYLYVLLPLGIVGAWLTIQRRRVAGLFALAIFVIYYGYFTLFGSGDYFLMIGPAYFVFTVWVGSAVAELAEKSHGVAHTAVLLVLPVAAVLLVINQFPGRYRVAQENHSAAFVKRTFELLPQNSIVLARWPQFTQLVYHQQIHDQRPDLTVMLAARTVRHYDHGEVPDFRPYIESRICAVPVVTNKLSDDVIAGLTVTPLDERNEWHRLEPGANDLRCTVP